MKVLTKFIDGWLWRTAIGPWFRCYILDYHDLSLPQDQEYVRWSREQWFLGGQKLEEVQAGREDRLPLVPPQLEPLRQLLRDTRWLGGDTPNYADFSALATFLWTASVEDAAADRGRSAARLARPRLRPLRRARPPPRHAQPVRAEAARRRSRAVRAGRRGSGGRADQSRPRLHQDARPRERLRARRTAARQVTAKAHEVAIRSSLADADEDVTGQPVVPALRCFESGLRAQVVVLVRHGRATLEGPGAEPGHRIGRAPPEKPRFCM